MANKKTEIEIDEDAQYDVDLKRAIRIGHIRIRPGAATLKGRVIKGLEDGVAINIRAVAD